MKAVGMIILCRLSEHTEKTMPNGGASILSNLSVFEVRNGFGHNCNKSNLLYAGHTV